MMKIFNYVLFFVVTIAIFFLFSLQKLSYNNLNILDNNFNIAVSLTGEADAAVVADRIEALDGIKEVKILTADEIYRDFRKDENISEKIILDENPFYDYLLVYPESITAGISVLVEKIKITGGVGNVVYDASVKNIYSVLLNLRKITLFVIGSLILLLLFFYVALIREKVKSGIALLKLEPGAFYFVVLAAISFIINNVICTNLGLENQYLYPALFLALLSLLASFAHAD